MGPTPGPVETTVLFQGGYTGFEGPRREVVTTTDRWRAVWATLQQGRHPMPAVPEVDFASRSVLLAAMGRRSTAGYEIAIREVETIAPGLRATVVEASPGQGCVTAQVLTAPALAARVPVPNPEVQFELREETRDCG